MIDSDSPTHPMKRPVRVLVFSTLYPSAARPQHGIFVETRLRELLATGEVEARVLAPVPWFFSTDPRYGEKAQMAAACLRIPNARIIGRLKCFFPARISEIVDLGTIVSLLSCACVTPFASIKWRSISASEEGSMAKAVSPVSNPYQFAASDCFS